jgi:hypothetical protein
MIYKVANLPQLENMIQTACEQLEALRGTMEQIQSFEFVLESQEANTQDE